MLQRVEMISGRDEGDPLKQTPPIHNFSSVGNSYAIDLGTISQALDSNGLLSDSNNIVDFILHEQRMTGQRQRRSIM